MGGALISAPLIKHILGGCRRLNQNLNVYNLKSLISDAKGTSSDEVIKTIERGVDIREL